MKIRKITLPVLRKIIGTDITNENDTLESILPKLKEEYEEFIEAVTENHPIEHKIEEYFDLIQTCIRIGKVLEREHIDIEKYSKIHCKKLKDRNWIFDNFIDIFYKVPGNK